MSLACYCNSHHHFRADHPVAGCLVSGCDCQAMSGGPDERARDDVQACKNIIEVWLRVFDLRGSPPPITWAHLSDLADAFAALLASERAAQAAQTRVLREALERLLRDEAHPVMGDLAREAARAALTGAPREEP